MATNEFLWFGDSLVLLYQSIPEFSIYPCNRCTGPNKVPLEAYGSRKDFFCIPYLDQTFETVGRAV